MNINNDLQFVGDASVDTLAMIPHFVAHTIQAHYSHSILEWAEDCQGLFRFLTLATTSIRVIWFPRQKMRILHF